MDIDTSNVEGKVVIVRLDGRLNMVAAPRLKSEIEAVVEAGGTHVLVDLTAVPFMDSSGLGALIAALKKARQAHGDLRIAGAGDQVTTVLRLTNLDRVLRPYDTVEAACDGW